MTTVLTMLFATILTAGCGPERQDILQELALLNGAWKGRQIARFDRPFSEIMLFSRRSDSSVGLSLKYEIGPRSRIWRLNDVVSYRQGTYSWNEDQGTLSTGKDSMRVVRRESGGPTEWTFVRDRSADSLISALSALSPQPYVYTVPAGLDDGWDCADLAEAGLEKSGIVKLIEEIRNGKHDDIHSLIVVKDNKLVVEEYFGAGGAMHGPLITRLLRDKVHHLASTTKGITSILVGIAIDMGRIGSADDPISRYLPAYSSLFTGKKKQLRISHMLTMTPGFEWRQFGVSDAENDGMQMWNTDDVIRYVLQKPLIAEPGEEFNYTNGVPTVTGAILKNAVRMEVTAFAEKHLFSPLGIKEYVWTRYPDGSLETDGGLALRSRDLAKIGQLMIDDGVWKGQKVVSVKWIKELTRERLKFGKLFSKWGYSYYWMQKPMNFGDRDISMHFVPGDGNQILAVFPDLAMVVVVTAGNYGRDPKPEYASLFEKYVLPSVIPGR
jgi:CubicO group peptidase (beta-lactamase class C family)